MKKIFWFPLMVVLALSIIACASTGAGTGSSRATRLNGVPDFVNEAYLQADDDVLVGIGFYNIGNDRSRMAIGKTTAETRARTDIAQQLRTILDNMVTDYIAANEFDSKAQISFQDTITRALSRADLRGARTKMMNTQDGMLWIVMEYSKKAAANDYNAAAAEARLAVPQAASFNAQDRMDAAFNKLAGGGPVPVGE
jgi:hypothetical protein